MKARIHFAGINQEVSAADAEGIIDKLITLVGAPPSHTPAANYKRIMLDELNEAENKHYDTKMSFEEFLQTLQAEEMLTVTETGQGTDDEPQPPAPTQ